MFPMFISECMSSPWDIFWITFELLCVSYDTLLDLLDKALFWLLYSFLPPVFSNDDLILQSKSLLDKFRLLLLKTSSLFLFDVFDLLELWVLFLFESSFIHWEGKDGSSSNQKLAKSFSVFIVSSISKMIFSSVFVRYCLLSNVFLSVRHDISLSSQSLTRTEFTTKLRVACCLSKFSNVKDLWNFSDNFCS